MTKYVLSRYVRGLVSKDISQSKLGGDSLLHVLHSSNNKCTLHTLTHIVLRSGVSAIEQFWQSTYIRLLSFYSCSVWFVTN